MGGSSTQITNAAEKLSSLEIQSSAYGVALPIVYGKQKVAGNLLWFGNFQSHEHRESQKSGGKGGGGSTTTTTITYTYTVSAMMGLCEGTVSSIGRVWVGDSVYSSLSKVGLSLATGAVGQAIWSTVRSVKPAEAVPYSGIAYVCGTDYDLGESAQMRNHQFELVGKLAYTQSSSTPDVNPADVLSDVLTNTRYGAGFSSSRLDLTNWKSYCAAAGLLMSPAFSTQESAADIVTKFGELTNSEPVWNGEKFTMIPRCEETISSTYGTYTPNSTPVYDLDDDDYLANEDGAVRVEIKPQADSKNLTSVEYTNRDNDYATEVADAQDQADIDVYGERSADSVEADWVCDGTIARKVAQLLLQRSLYIRKTYSFSLPWTFALLSPMDIVTLTDTALGLSREPVRITSISEGDDGCLDVEAEELLYGVASAAEYSQQKGAGFIHNFSVDPGNVSAPKFLETPVKETTTGLEVGVAVAGADSNWGGCEVYYSLEGTSYRKLGKIQFGTIYGSVIAKGSGYFDVQIVRGTFPDVSARDAASLDVVGWIGGTTPEYFGIGSATLIGTKQYRISGLNRAAFGTSQSEHSVGDDFILVEYKQMARTGAIDRDQIGKTILFKFCSFNIYESQLQSLENVDAYGYTIRGVIAQLPPTSAVTGLSATFEEKGLLLEWNAYDEPDVKHYEVRAGGASATWATASSIGVVDATYTSIEENLTPGVHRYFVAAVDDFGNVGPSTYTELTVVAPSVCLSVSTQVVDNNVMIYWSEPSTHSFPIREYLVRDGSSWESGKDVGTNGNSTFAAIFERDAGTKTYWLRAVDNCGNLGALVSVTAEVTAPPDYELYDDRLLGLNSSAGSFTNTLFETGTALLPVNTTETWAQHFVNNGFNSPQDQIDEGYTLYAQPGESSGSMTWEIDYGTVVSSTFTLETNIEKKDSDASVSYQLYTKVNSGDDWTAATAGATTIFAFGVRYFKVVITVTNGMVVVRSVRARLDVKKLTDAGSATSNASDATGTLVNFNVSFSDVTSIQLQPVGTTEAIALLNFDDVPNPTGFRVLIFDRSGNRITRDFTWTARGIKA